MAEVLISMVVLSVSALALFSCFSTGFINMRMTRENQRAIQILLDKTETIRLYNWNQVTFTNNFLPTSFTNVYDPQAAVGAQGVVYTGTVSLVAAPIGASYSNDMKQLTVSLTWRTGSVLRTRQVSTFIGRNGIQNYIY